jgi:uncharacterized protein (TIGR00730 family)
MDKKSATKKLHELDDITAATILKARASWSMFSIMSEFIETTEQLSSLKKAVSIFGSARTPGNDPYYLQCVEVARRLSDEGFAIISGGGPGIMAAANQGAFPGRSLSIGLNIDLPAEQSPNPWQDIALHFRHFFARKVAFVKYADAYILFPGGFGTLDELCETLTLIQTQKSRRIPVILVGSVFWHGLLTWLREVLVPHGTLSESDVALMTVIDETDKIVEAILSFCADHRNAPTDEEKQKRMYL